MSDDLPGEFERMLRSETCPQPEDQPEWSNEVADRFVHQGADDIQLKIQSYGRYGWYVKSDTYRNLENTR